MKLFIHFLLISSLSIIIIAEHLENARIERLIEKGPFFLMGLPDHTKLLKGGELFRSDHTLVWRGTYNDNTDVAVKIFRSKDTFESEKAAYERLNALADDFDIQKHRIPRVYYCGPIFGRFHAIVMTFFHDNLLIHFYRRNKYFSDSTILLIFKQAVEALKYIHSKRVLHNNIVLRDLFIRGQNVFIADFDMANLEEEYLLSDYEKLLEVIWLMLRGPCQHGESVDAKIACFNDLIVRNAFGDIVKINSIQIGNYTLPNHDRIIEVADEALAQISGTSEPVQFDWLTKGQNPLSGEPSYVW